MNAFKTFASYIDSFFTNQETVMPATIKPVNSAFGLFDNRGDLVQTYARARDAKRGATRRGFTVA